MTTDSKNKQRWNQEIAFDPALPHYFSNMLSSTISTKTASRSQDTCYYQQQPTFNTFPHFIVNEQRGLVLHFHRDYDNISTHLSLLKPTKDGFELLKEQTVDDILGFGAAMGERWLTITNKIHGCNTRVYIEEWDWELLEPMKKRLIPHEKFSWLNFALSPDFKTILVDGFLLPSERGTAHARIYSFPELQELGAIDRNNRLLSPSFNATGDKLVYVNDQGSGEAHLLELKLLEFKNERFEQTQVSANNKTGMDFTYTATHFTPNGIQLFQLQRSGIDASMYSESGDSVQWRTHLSSTYQASTYQEDIQRVAALSEFNFEELEGCLRNTVLVAHIDADHAFVGGVGKIYQINLLSGALTRTIPITGMSLIVQVRRLGDSLITLDHRNVLGKMDF